MLPRMAVFQNVLLLSRHSTELITISTTEENKWKRHLNVISLNNGKLTIVEQSSIHLPISDGHLKSNDAFLKRASMSVGGGNFVAATNTELTSIRWLQDQMDDLDVWIARRDFEEAVQNIEKGIVI
jgi:hypothetical protein